MKYLAVLFICCSLCGCGDTPVVTGGSCPELFADVQLKDMEGRDARVPCSGHSVLLVNLWASWCGPCKLEVPHLAEISRDFKARGVQVIGISMDAVVDQKSFKSVVAGFGIPYSVLAGSPEKIFQRTGIDGIPATIIIAADGTIRKILVGYHTREELLAPVKELLREKPQS